MQDVDVGQLMELTFIWSKQSSVESLRRVTHTHTHIFLTLSGQHCDTDDIRVSVTREEVTKQAFGLLYPTDFGQLWAKQYFDYKFKTQRREQSFPLDSFEYQVWLGINRPSCLEQSSWIHKPYLTVTEIENTKKDELTRSAADLFILSARH